jgi:hypothetical protein
MKAYRASANDGSAVTDATPRAAALAFFARFPGKRKCHVIEGDTDGQVFSVTYGRASLGQWPTSWRDVTPKTASALPDPHALDREKEEL